jgi:hypothetical protein
VFLHPVGSAGHAVHFDASGARNICTLFFIIRCKQYRFLKKCARTRYAKLVFLHLVGFVGHVMHSSASGAEKVDALFFMLGWV